jgi:hypothetical protein
MAETEVWRKIDDDSYMATVRGRVYHLRLIDDGVLPAGWRVWRDGAKFKTPLVAEGRPEAVVLGQAEAWLLAFAR